MPHKSVVVFILDFLEMLLREFRCDFIAVFVLHSHLHLREEDYHFEPFSCEDKTVPESDSFVCGETFEP